MNRIAKFDADQVRAARSLLGWSQTDLARRSAVAVSTVADFERGQRAPVPNNLRAMRETFEAAGIVFLATGVSYGFQWTFMSEGGMTDLSVAFDARSSGQAAELASIFGTVEPPTITIKPIQCVTEDLREQLKAYLERHQLQNNPIASLLKKLRDMRDGEFFLILTKPPESTAEQLRYEQVLAQLNHPQEKPFEEIESLFGRLLEHYDIIVVRTDKNTLIGNRRKEERVCRFCGGALATGSTFNSKAHAIPTSVGNKLLRLADECDTCNNYFGKTIETAFTEVLNIQRIFLGIEGRGGVPSAVFTEGAIKRGDSGRLMVKARLTSDAAGVLTASLGKGKPFSPQDFYRALGKIAISLMPQEELPALERTIRWVRYGESSNGDLPLISAAVVMLPPDPCAQVTLHIRKDEDLDLPHVVAEFRLGCYLYVYALPFSDKDQRSLVGFYEKQVFNDVFKHYAYVPNWSRQDFSGTTVVDPVHTIRMQPNEALGRPAS